MVIYVIYYNVMILSKNNNLLENKARINTTFYHFENQSIAVIIPALCLGKIKCKHQYQSSTHWITFVKNYLRMIFCIFFLKIGPTFLKKTVLHCQYVFFNTTLFISPGLKSWLEMSFRHFWIQENWNTCKGKRRTLKMILIVQS